MTQKLMQRDGADQFECEANEPLVEVTDRDHVIGFPKSG